MKAHLLTKATEDFGINGVTLFEHAYAFGEVTHLPGVDDRDGNIRLLSGLHESSLITACGFTDDHGIVRSEDLSNERASGRIWSIGDGSIDDVFGIVDIELG